LDRVFDHRQFPEQFFGQGKIVVKIPDIPRMQFSQGQKVVHVIDLFKEIELHYIAGIKQAVQRSCVFLDQR